MKRAVSVISMILAVLFLLSACAKTSPSTDGGKEPLSLDTSASKSNTGSTGDEKSNEPDNSGVDSGSGSENSGVNDAGDDDHVEIVISPAMADAFDIDDEDVNGDHPFTSLTKNSDGSFTIVMTKGQQEDVLEMLSSTISEAFDELIKSEYCSFTDIQANDDYTSFTVKTDSEELGLMDSFMIMEFYTFGGMYNTFSGRTVDNIHVDFINDSTGDAVESADSGDLEAYFESIAAIGDYEYDDYEDSSETEIDPDSVTVVAEYTLPDSFGWYTRHYYVVRNDGNVAVDVSTNTVAYDADGNVVSSADGTLSALAPGCVALFYEAFETDAEVSSYDPVFSVRETYYIPVMQDLSIERTDIKGGAVVKVTNNGEIDAEFVELTALFFMDGKLVDTDYTYCTNDDNIIPPGQTISAQLDSYEEFDTMEIYMSGGQNYGW